MTFDGRATEADIEACFRLLLGRNPHPEERAGHFSRAGERLDSVVASYVNSLEFTRRRLQTPTTDVPDRADLDGFRILAHATDLAVGRHVLAGRYEPEVEAVFRTALRPGMTVIDVGANIGFFTLLAAALVGPRGRVIGIEPNPANARLAEASRRLNGFDHATIVQAAAGPAVGMLAINTSFSNGMTSALEDTGVLQATTVACLPIDRLVPPGCRVDFMKLDVEGAEYQALLGAETILRRDHPLLVLEFGPAALSGISGEGLLQWLVARNYAFEVIRPDAAPTPVGQDGAAVMRAYEAAGTDHIDIIARPLPPPRTAWWRPGARPKPPRL